MQTIKILSWLICVFLFVGILIGQDEKKAPLELKIELKQIDQCSENVIVLAVSLINKSDDDVLIDTKAIGDSLSFSVVKIKHGKVTSTNKTIIGDSSKEYTPDYKLLKSSEIFEKTLRIVLDDEFFDQKGKYEIIVGYRQFDRLSDRGRNLWIGSVYSNPLTVNFPGWSNEQL